MSNKIKNITDEVEEIQEIDEVEEVEETKDSEEVGVTGGIVLLRTDDGRIVYEKMDEVTWEDITMFSEYLNRLKDAVWREHVRIDNDED